MWEGRGVVKRGFEENWNIFGEGYFGAEKCGGLGKLCAEKCEGGEDTLGVLV